MKKIRTFGFKPEKMADLPMEDLLELKNQVEVEHANKKLPTGYYFEAGMPTLYLYDKKGRWKLDKITWAITYKLQEAKRKA